MSSRHGEDDPPNAPARRDPRVEIDESRDPDPERTPVRPALRPAPVVVRAGTHREPLPSNRTLSPLGAHPIGRINTPSGPIAHVPVPDPVALAGDDITPTQRERPEHEANRHLRVWARLSVENRRLVAAVSVALLAAQVPADR